ncbi:MAG: hypothetical protein M4579_002456 [Chaenotheca gracillima]|nr:MAG: hypothetical protein M4579_002456 [Chaenotheca gracillima]
MRVSLSLELITALLLSFSTFAVGHVVQKRQICLEDGYLQGMQNDGIDATPFCSSWLGIPLVTRTVRTVTPTVTSVRTIQTTRLATARTSGTTTATITSTSYIPAVPRVYRRDIVPRDAAPGPTAKALDYVNLARRADSQNITSIISALSSACSCLEIPQSTTRVSVTATPSTRTLTAYDITSSITTVSRIFSVTAYTTITVVTGAPSSSEPLPATSSVPGTTATVVLPTSAGSTTGSLTTSLPGSSGAADTRTGLLTSTIFNATGSLLPTIPVNSTVVSPTNSSILSGTGSVNTRTGLQPTTSAPFSNGTASTAVSGTGSLPTTVPSNSTVLGGTGSLGTGSGAVSSTSGPYSNGTASTAISGTGSLPTTVPSNSTVLGGTGSLGTRTGALSSTAGPYPNGTSTSVAAGTGIVPTTTPVTNSTAVQLSNTAVPSGTGILDTRTGLLPTSTPPFVNSSSGINSETGYLSPTIPIPTALPTTARPANITFDSRTGRLTSTASHNGVPPSLTSTSTTSTTTTPTTNHPPPINTCVTTPPIVNGGFETFNGTRSPGWKSSSAGGNITFINEASTTLNPSHSGNRAALIKTFSNSGSLILMETIPICAGVTYDFSAWVRRPIAKAGCEVIFILGGSIVSSQIVSKTTATYEQMTGTYGPRASFVKLELVAFVDCDEVGYGVPYGEVYLDDVSLIAQA